MPLIAPSYNWVGGASSVITNMEPQSHYQATHSQSKVTCSESVRPRTVGHEIHLSKNLIDNGGGGLHRRLLFSK